MEGWRTSRAEQRGLNAAEEQRCEQKRQAAREKPDRAERHDRKLDRDGHADQPRFSYLSAICPAVAEKSRNGRMKSACARFCKASEDIVVKLAV